MGSAMSGEQHRGPEGKRGFLTGIESVRGIAALYVAFGHTLAAVLLFNYKLSIFGQPNVRDAALKVLSCVFNAQTAVVVFFVISGLVIGRALDQRGAPQAALSRGRYVLFVIRRALRLYPAHLVATAGVLLLAWLFLMGRPPIDFSPYPEMNPGFAAWFNGDIFNPLRWREAIGTAALLTWRINLVVWSLYVEMWVAPLLPLFHFLSRKRDPRLDAVVLAALLALALATWGHELTSYWFVFYLGMLVESHGRRWAELLARHLGVGGAVALAYAAMALPDLVVANRPAPVVVAEAFSAFTLISLIVRFGDWPRFRVLDHSFVRWNGRLSYSFYLWHLMILTVLTHALYSRAAPAFMHRFEVPIFFGLFTISVAIALAIAHLSYRFVEKPGIRFGYWLETMRARPAAPALDMPAEMPAPAKPA